MTGGDLLIVLAIAAWTGALTGAAAVCITLTRAHHHAEEHRADR